MNSKSTTWGDAADNCNGRVLYNWLQDNSADVTRFCDSSPSYPNGSSYLDHFLLSPSLIDCDASNLKISSLSTFSDHFPLKLELHMNSLNLILRTPRILTSYKNTNWDNFRRHLESASIDILPPANKNLINNEIDSCINDFNTTFTSLHDIHSERYEARGQKSPLPDNIKKFYKIKHIWQKELKKIFHRTGNRLSSEYNLLSKQIILLKSIIRELVNLEEAQIFNSRLKKIKPGPTAFKEIYQIVGKRKSPFCQQIQHDGTTTSCSSEMSQIFCNYYTSTFQETILERPVANLDTSVSSCLDVLPSHIYTFNNTFNALENQDNYHFTGVGKVKSLIIDLNNKKSSGFDGISNFMIKKFPDATIKLFTILFNNCINNGYFPKAWKSAKIIPIKKKRNSITPEEFRPISLLSNIGKVFENILKGKLDSEFVINPIPIFQFGFRNFHSTNHALLKFHSDVTTNLRNKTCTVAISLDIQKAFDNATHKGILYKLLDLGIDPYLMKMFHSFFSDREFRVQINDSLSEPGEVKSGVPQGSVLSPFLFNLFLHDFPHLTENSKALLYADDCMIYSNAISPIQALNNAAHHLGLISVFYKTWGININPGKSEAICIRNASGKCANFVVPQSKLLNLSLDGTDIPFKDTIKYLGINFDKLLKFNNHARSSLRKARAIAGMFSNLLSNKYLSKNTKLLLYKVAIRSVMVYGFPIWFSISPTVASELEKFERKVLRKCIGRNYVDHTKRFSNVYIYKNSGVHPFCKYAFSLQKKFAEKLHQHENDLMNDIFQSEENINWLEHAYLSPVGIMNEILDDDPEQYLSPDFYKKTTPGSHRG